MQNADKTKRNETLENINISLSYIKIGRKTLTFGDIEFEKINFTVIRLPFFFGDVDNKNFLVSNMISLGEKNYKYFIGYLHNDNKVSQLHIMLPKIRMKCKLKL